MRSGRLTLTLKQRNIEGAFPLLLVGSVLLVYCAVLRSEAIASSGLRFPLWGIVGAVGAVIAGSGVYSIFLDTAETTEPTAPDGFVLVPKAEWEAVHPRPAATATHKPSLPPWWEGPPNQSETMRHVTVPTVARAPPRSAPPTAPPATRTQPLAAPSTKVAGARITGPTPAARKPIAPATTKPRLTAPAPPKGSLEELRQTLGELEDLVNSNFKSTPRTVTKVGLTKSSSCADCGQEVPSSPAPNQCAGCGRRLCVDCALSSQFEDADLRCNECRARQS